MSNSPLVQFTRISPNSTNPRNHVIDTITIHHCAGVCTAETIAAIFAPEARQASCNYGIGNDGRIALVVDEDNRSWCSSSRDNDHRAITIEVSNSATGGDWPVSDQAMSSLINLCVDICKRNGIARLNYTGDTSGNLTMHKWFAATSCPGPYLESRFGWIAEQVNAQLDTNEEISTNENVPTSEPTLYRIRKTWEDAKSQIGAYESLDRAKRVCDSAGEEYHVFDENGHIVYPIQQVENVQKLYRVRKSADDAESQKGAYSSLDNAIKCCNNVGDGYHVFDWNYQVVYSYPSSNDVVEEEKKEEPVVVPVYDLDYPEKNKIVELDKVWDQTELERDCTKAIKCILGNNNNFDVEIAKTFFMMAPKYGIDPLMVISQSILETGWFKYSASAVTEDQYNYCGLGVTSNGMTGCAFNTIEDGVRAQLQHLYAYGCQDALPSGEEDIIDPRFKYVTRGIATYWQNLAGRWAVPGYDKDRYATPEEAMQAGDTYGQKIRRIYTEIEATTITDNDVEQYFKKNEDIVETAPSDNDEPKNDIAYVFKILRKILEAIINLFKSK